MPSPSRSRTSCLAPFASSLACLRPFPSNSNLCFHQTGAWRFAWSGVERERSGGRHDRALHSDAARPHNDECGALRHEMGCGEHVGIQSRRMWPLSHGILAEARRVGTGTLSRRMTHRSRSNPSCMQTFPQ